MKSLQRRNKDVQNKTLKTQKKTFITCAHKFDKFDSKASKAIGVLLCNMCNPNEI